jgi:GntR family transcriptional regulator
VASEPVRRVSRASQIPLHHQVANDLRERIESGAWRPGQRIPGEQELTDLYGASRTTIRQALASLAQEGLISREPGRGSFVRDPTITAGPRNLTSFSQEMRARGLEPSSRVLSIGIEPADEQVAAKLDLPEGSSVVRLERLRFGNGEAIGLQVAFLPAGAFPGLADVDFSKASLYGELERRYDTVVEEAEETYLATRIEAATARLLDVPDGAPGLMVERVAWAGGRPVEFTRSVMRGDRYRVQVRLRHRGLTSHRQARMDPSGRASGR